MVFIINFRLKIILMLFITYLIIQNFTRIAIILSTDSVSLEVFDILKTFIVSFIFDFTVYSVINLPLLLLLILNREYLIKIFVFIFDFLTILIAVSQFLFFKEFGTNFNFIAVDYLIYTNELLGNIWQSFNIPLLMILILILSILIYNLQRKFLKTSKKKFNYKYAIPIIFIPILCLTFVQSDWRKMVSENNYNVEISANGSYEFVRAYFTNEIDYDTFYITKDEININPEKYVSNQNEMTNINPNIVLITVESLNAEYLKIFGGDGLTPHLDELVDKSYLFTRMYATGTRTVRGLEAITLSLPPTPGQSIVRRENNDNLSSLGDTFKQNNYTRDFIYGGYGYFDNMNKFFEGNNYNVVDRTNIPDDEIIHETIWGVADEVLFTQVLKKMDEHFEKKERAFEMIMTTSNHRPFTFPENRIDMPDGTRNAAVKYTDWAINDFLERASKKEWFDNTIFVIIADHQALAAGKATLPVNCYHIPCLIYAPKLISPGKCDRLISQMDLAPTLLGILGLSYNAKFLGHDINKVNESDDRIFISTYQMLGYIKNNNLIILTPDKKATSYKINDWNTSDYTENEINQELLNEAINYYQGAAYLFKNNKLKVK